MADTSDLKSEGELTLRVGSNPASGTSLRSKRSGECRLSAEALAKAGRYYRNELRQAGHCRRYEILNV